MVGRGARRAAEDSTVAERWAMTEKRQEGMREKTAQKHTCAKPVLGS